MSATVEHVQTDDKGRVLAPDGLPVSGLAKPSEAGAVLSLSRSQVYAMIQRGELQAKRFGRACRIPWSAIRELISAD